MGWVMLAVIALAAVALMWLFGMPRALWSFVGAAVMLGASGYALQSRPGLAGHPVSREAEMQDVDQQLTDLRHAMFGRVTFANTYLTAADALDRHGSTKSAVRVVLAGIDKAPRDASLWTGLGTAYTEHDGGLISPAAQMAFSHAMRLAPDHPGPPFYYGLALVRAGRMADALPYWKHALALTPADASYRRAIAARVALLGRYLALSEQQEAEQPAR